MTEDFKRKLTAILSADAEGYSRLMGEDEDSTVRTLKAYRKLMSSLIEKFNGRVVDSPGDNLLAEFESVRDAVQCAVVIQDELRIKNIELPVSKQMKFRIGINLGDVIHDEDRIYGDGINVASRVESLAEGGGVNISGTVYDSIKNKLDMNYEFQGEHNVKNIKDPVRVYRVLMGFKIADQVVEEKKIRSSKSLIRNIAVVVFIIIAVLLAWRFYPIQRIKTETQTIESQQVPVIPEDKELLKSIAVLPFNDDSPKKDQEYFCNGVAEELINKLAQVKDLQVTARNSSFYFKGKNVDMRTIGEKLGVAYLLEGSVRKSGDQLRITAQLIKAEDGYHLWSETYDRELKDIFAIQDDISKAVTTALSITLGVGEFNRPGMTHNIEAYDEYLRAISNRYKFTPYSTIEAIDQFKKTLDIDPNFVLGWIGLWRVYNNGIQILPPGQTVGFEARAIDALKRARAVAPNMPGLLMATAEEHTSNGNWLEADRIWNQILEEQGHANSDANRYYGEMLLRTGRNSDALLYLQRAKRLDPLSSLNSCDLVWILINLGRLDEAQAEVERGKNLEGFDQSLIFFEWAIAFEAGDIIAAIELIEDFYNIEKNDTSKILSEAFMLKLVDLLKDKNTDFALNKVRQMATDKSRSHWERWLLAIWSGMLGDPQLSFDIFKEVPGFRSIMPWARNLGCDIRQLPVFKEWLLENGFVDYWRGTGKWPDLCHPVGDDDFECD